MEIKSLKKKKTSFYVSLQNSKIHCAKCGEYLDSRLVNRVQLGNFQIHYLCNPCKQELIKISLDTYDYQALELH